ncbi:hypothetical protein KORDIASMS9_04470 [Kordia sp. SMS9]|uniref:DUF5763 domain-containing protein n=1 Tax=Kordia sp. SMS9 TaxID=2282170 RepID=UPI000E10243B|nr:DUF5763 domain-containing protein [Kordia sp. SMS9]AXG72202.1 hypothetical protein KORDIASMS9_04470 [Kordia sp. SMS9]
MKYLFSIFFFATVSWYCQAQNVYKTPSGARYHLSSCRMVENVSSKLSGVSEIDQYQLTPCKICKPPPKHKLRKGNNLRDKSVGTSKKTVRCKDITQKGTRCQHKTHLANGYCFQHTKQDQNSPKNASNSSKNTTSLCGARTKSGKRCRRKVKGSGFCYQHD